MTKLENDRRVTRALWALRAYVEAVKAPPISPQSCGKNKTLITCPTCWPILCTTAMAVNIVSPIV